MSTYVSHLNNPTRKDMLAIAGLTDKDLEELSYQHSGIDFEDIYIRQILSILKDGVVKKSRPGQYTLTNASGCHFKADLSGFRLPLMTKRYIPYKSGLVELFWFLRGFTDIQYLKSHGVGIWDEWVIPGTERFSEAQEHTPKELMNYVRLKLGTDLYRGLLSYLGKHQIAKPTVEQIDNYLNSVGVSNSKLIKPQRLTEGDIGPAAYGAQWRSWKDYRHVQPTNTKEKERLEQLGYTSIAPGVYYKNIDQILELENMLRTNPDNRRMVVSCWDPSKLPECSLPWCHYGFQAVSTENPQSDRRDLTITVTQRSADVLLGTPTNLYQYALLCHLLASTTNHTAREVKINAADAHIYEDQLPHLKEYLFAPKANIQALMDLRIELPKIDSYIPEDVRVKGYSKEQCSSAITFPVAV